HGSCPWDKSSSVSLHECDGCCGDFSNEGGWLWRREPSEGVNNPSSTRISQHTCGGQKTMSAANHCLPLCLRWNHRSKRGQPKSLLTESSSQDFLDQAPRDRARSLSLCTVAEGATEEKFRVTKGPLACLGTR
ncbi:mCG145935, partial [Mus musculus]